MDLSIVTVPWNVKDLVRDNFKAIYKNTSNIKFEVISVDNDSKDCTTEMIKKDFPKVLTILNNYNAGFAKANNQGIKISSGRYVLLLNPDMKVKEGTLESMVKWMDSNPNAGIAGCKLINDRGKNVPHIRRFPSLFDQFMVASKLSHLFPSSINKYMNRDFNYSKAKEVDSIRGAFFMIRREVLDKLKGLDERYFIWFEEVDFCREAKKNNFKVMYTPEVECINYSAKSFEQVPSERLQRIFKNSMLSYFMKWHSPLSVFILKFGWVIGGLITYIAKKFNFKKKKGVN